jgi:diguanylate cyclase
MDLDYFKEFNDRFGHLSGDSVLCSIAGVVQSAIRDQDTAARFGGEEFCLLLPATEAEGALTLVEKIKSSWKLGEGGAKGVTFSAGIAQWDLSEDPEVLFKRADDALYQAKSSGRNRILKSDPTIASHFEN